MVRPYWVGTANLIAMSDATGGASEEVNTPQITATSKKRTTAESSAGISDVKLSPANGRTSYIAPSLPVFRVSARVKAIWDRLLSQGSDKGQLRFADLEKVSLSLRRCSCLGDTRTGARLAGFHQRVAICCFWYLIQNGNGLVERVFREVTRTFGAIEYVAVVHREVKRESEAGWVCRFECG